MHGDRAGCPAFWGGLSLIGACPRAHVGTHPGPQGWPGGGGGARGLSLDATWVLLGWHRGVPLPSARPHPQSPCQKLTSPSHPELVPAPGRLHVTKQCHLLAKPPPSHPTPPVLRHRLGMGKLRHEATEPQGAQRGLPPAPRPLSPACPHPRGPLVPSAWHLSTLAWREREKGAGPAALTPSDK